MDLFTVPSGEISLAPNIIGSIGGIPLSSGVLTGFLVSILAIILSIIVQLTVKLDGKPTRLQLVFESMYSWFYDLVEKISGDKSVAKKIIPIVAATTFFIALSNVITIIPGLTSLEYNGNTLFTTNTTSLNTTFAIASITVLWSHVSSIKQFNIFNHILKYVRIQSIFLGFKQIFTGNIKQGMSTLAMVPIDLFLGILDIISEFAKTLSLSLRLFGNMFAGEILASLLMASFALVLPVFLTAYGVFVGVLQAIVFGALVASYFGAALRE